MSQFRAVVIGAGMAGLVAGYQLTLAGFRPLLLEQSAAVGGAVATHTVAGIELDAGAESFAVGRPSVTELLGDLGMSDAVVAPAALGAWVRHEAGSAPLPGTALLGIPGHVGAADVRRVIGWPGAIRATVDSVLPPRFAAPTLGGLARRRMGSRVLRRLVEPVVGGVHASDPSVLEVDAIAPGLISAMGSAGSLAGAVRTLRGAAPPGAAVAGIRGGMARLPAALAAAIVNAGGDIHCGVKVSGVEQVDSGWRVHAAGVTMDATAIVVALPADGIHQLLGAVSGDGTMPADSGLSTPVALATLVIDDARLDAAPRGTGILVAPTATGVRAKALTHATAKWPWLAESLPAGRHVLRLSYGRSGFAGENGAAAIPADADLPAAAMADASALLGIALRESDVRGSDVVRWPSSLPQAREGHATAVARLRLAVSSRRGVAVVGSAMAGNGLAAVVADARTQAGALAARIAAG